MKTEAPSTEPVDPRLKMAREAATYAAWLDMLAAFTDQQRKHIANQLAHKWHIGGVILRNTNEGRDYSHTVTGGEQPHEPRAQAVSSIDYWQQRGHVDSKFKIGDQVAFYGVLSEVTEVQERQYTLHRGSIAWEHELQLAPTKVEK